MKISVIIPIYGVERFIEKCAKSLFSQTLQDVEFIFVNDATKDKSIEILRQVLNQYPARKNQVKILEHICNKGLPAARNTGLSVAEGEYIYHCDSDDWMEPDMLISLYEFACKGDLDYVWCDWFLSYNRKERYMSQKSFSTPINLVCGMLSDSVKYNVWNKLVRRSLYLDYRISFPEGHSMGEDMTMIKLASCAHKVGYLPKAFYHYVKTNNNAMTNQWKERSLNDVYYNVYDTLSFLDNHVIIPLEVQAFFKLNVKLPFLISLDKDLYYLWEKWFPEANSYIWKNHSISKRIRILQWMAAHRQWWYVYIHYYIIYKVIYRKLYL